MPQPYRPHTPHSLAILPIPLSTTLSLITTLGNLQLLYAASFMLSLIRRSNGSPVLQDTIQRIEKHTIDLLLHIIPASAFRSPPSSCLLHEDPLGHRIVSAARSTPRAQLSNVSSTSTVIPHVMLQCYPANVVERTYPGPSTPPAHDSIQPLPDNCPDQTRAGPSAYETMMMCDPKTKERMSRILHHNDPILPRLSEMNKSKSRQQCDEAQLPETCTLDISEPVPDMPDAACLNQTSPASSPDEPSARTLRFTNAPTESSHPFLVPLARSTRCASTESYPGNFPTSDAVTHRDFAFTPVSFRERGTTSVRPFSDY